MILLINGTFAFASLVPQWKIDNWLLQLPGEEIYFGASISLNPSYINRNIQGNICLKDIYLYDTRGTQTRKVVFDKISAIVNHQDFLIGLGYLDVQYSPYTVGRTQREELLFGNQQIRGISILDYEFAKGKASGFLGWPENANAVFGCKLDLPVEEDKIVLIYANDLRGSAGNKLEAPIINEQVFTAELTKQLGLMNIFTAIYGCYYPQEASSNEQLFCNLKLGSKAVENNLVEIGFWNMDQNFNFKYRDRQPADPFERRWTGNIVDQLIGKRGYFIKTQSTDTLLRQLELIYYRKKADEENKVRDIYFLLGKNLPNQMMLMMDFNAEDRWLQNQYGLNKKQIQHYTSVGIEKGFTFGGGNLKALYKKGFNLDGVSKSDYRLIVDAQFGHEKTPGSVEAKYEQLFITGTQLKSFALSYQLSKNLFFLINVKQQSGSFGEGRVLADELPLRLIDEGLLDNYSYIGLQGRF